MGEPSEHLPSLDALRAIAVGMVVVFHVGEGSGTEQSSTLAGLFFRATALGSCGVDLFFVLSGFLITRILLASRGQPGYFRSFYGRRVLRIFPAYYLYLVLLALALASIPAAHLTRDAFARGWPWYATYLTNIKLIYFYDRDPGSIHHLWSLAVEEHFYLLWPAVLALVPPRALLASTAVVIAIVTGVRAWWLAQGVDAFAVHILTWTRIDALLIGAAIAMLRVNARAWPKLVRGAPLLAAAAIVGWFVTGPAWGLRYDWVGLLCAAVLVRCVAADERGETRAVFRSRVLQRVGVISYGVYLFHFFFVLSLRGPVRRVFGEEFGGFVVLLLVVSLATWLLAELSFRWVESPALALKRHFPRPGSG